jgi:sortase A
MHARRVFLRGLQIFCLLLVAFSAWVLTFGRIPGEDVRPPVVARAETGTHIALPARVRVARLEIDAPIVSVGLTHDGRMEVPDDPTTVGWFSPGTIPGAEGSAVLSGHLDTIIRTPGVFARIKELVPGDEIDVTTQSGGVLRFVVRRTESYPYDESPLREIFAGTGGIFLNLITCDGRWIRHTYDRRMVVYAEKVEDESAGKAPR